MKPFCIATICGILGILMGLYFKSIVLFIVFFISILLVLVVCGINPVKEKTKIIIFFLSFFLFWGYTIVQENRFIQINEKYKQKEIEIQAIVISDKNEKEFKDVYHISVIKVKEGNQEKKEKFNLVLNVKREKQNSTLLKYGDIIYLKGVYEAPSVARNEGGFDYSQYLKTQRIAGTITIKAKEIKVIGKNNLSGIGVTIHSIRNSIIKRVKTILPENTANLCTGLLVGEKTQLSEEVQEKFRNSSLSHLLAISGTHISYILLGMTQIVQKTKIHKKWGKILLAVFLIFFMNLVGGTPSVTRSCIMVILQLLASILHRKSDTYQNLAISSFIILLINPYTLLDIGFQLSFGGSIGIVVIAKKLQSKEFSTQKTLVLKRMKKIKEMCMVTLAANLVIIPIMMYHFNTISLTFLISNLLASPILGISLILGMIFIVSLLILPLAQFLSLFLQPILQLLIWIAEVSSKLPFSHILVPTPKIWQIILYYLFLTLIFFPKTKLQDRITFKKVITILLLFLIISPYIWQLIPNNQLIISFIDVGQGDSMLIQTPSRKTILIDGGGSQTSNFDVGEKTLIPYLLDKGVMSIDYMIFSHFDSDHCQGLLKVMEKLKVRNAIISKQGENSNNYMQFLRLAQENKIKVMVVKAEEKVIIDKKCYISILFPEEELINANILNNNSIVAKFIYQMENKCEFSLLLTGDIEQIAEKQLVEVYEKTNAMQATILKVAHHRVKNFLNTAIFRISKAKNSINWCGRKKYFWTSKPNNIK